jgi:hypothetical protein
MRRYRTDRSPRPNRSVASTQSIGHLDPIDRSPRPNRSVTSTQSIGHLDPIDRSPLPQGSVTPTAGGGPLSRGARSERPQVTVASTVWIGHPDPRTPSHRPQRSVRATAGNGPDAERIGLRTESNGHQYRMDRSWEPKLGSPGPIHSPYPVVMMPAHPLPAPAWTLAWECGSTGQWRCWVSAVGTLPGRKVAGPEVVPEVCQRLHARPPYPTSLLPLVV